MKYIYSRIQPETLLHIIHFAGDFESRKELIDANNFIQAASIEFDASKIFLSHKHLDKQVSITSTIAQEGWVVISGKVEASYFDIDDKFLEKTALNAGDLSITLQGGHGYKFIEHSRVYEFKSGPYLGQLLDKTFIEEGNAPTS
jgi:hypothetical protein